MLLALRKGPQTNATLWQRFACWVIKARLVSQYCHGGIVIRGRLYHSTSTGGLHFLEAAKWNPENWDLFDVGGDDDEALWHFTKHKGAKYDWLSLLAFIGANARDSKRFYCFEWCWLAMTGGIPKTRITPEMLLAFSTKVKND